MSLPAIGHCPVYDSVQPTLVLPKDWDPNCGYFQEVLTTLGCPQPQLAQAPWSMIKQHLQTCRIFLQSLEASSGIYAFLALQTLLI